MTGYGKAEAMLSSGKLTLEIRTLNGKSADISIKSSLLPKEKDLEVRKLLADKLVRGTIDLFVTFEPAAGEGSHSINADAFHAYWKSVVAALDKETIFTKTFLKDPGVGSILASSILRLPEVVDARKADVITPEEWPLVASALDAPVPDGGLVLAFGAAPTYAELVAFLEGRLGPPASRKAAAGAFEESETRWTVPASGGGARTVRATEVQGVVRFFLRGANP